MLAYKLNTTGNPNADYKFTGYEVDDDLGLNLYNAGARLYDPVIGRFMQMDPLHMERPGLSPFNYAQNNPLLRIDTTGKLDIIAKSIREQETILNTLSKEERRYVSFDKNGLINKELISTGSGGGNFSALQKLAISNTVYEISIGAEFEINGDIESFSDIYIGDDNNQGIYGLSTAEEGFLGIFLMPSETSNGNAQIHLNNKLTTTGLAEIFSHEAYGHAFLFESKIPNSHIYETMPDGTGFREGNKILKKQIIDRMNETRLNMRRKNDW